MESLETPQEAVMREVKEEVGLEVRVQRLLGIYAVPEQETFALTFLCVMTGGSVCVSAEADDIQWFKKDKLPPNTLARHVERVEDAFKGDKTVFMRVQAHAEPAQK